MDVKTVYLTDYGEVYLHTPLPDDMVFTPVVKPGTENDEYPELIRPWREAETEAQVENAIHTGIRGLMEAFWLRGRQLKSIDLEWE